MASCLRRENGAGRRRTGTYSTASANSPGLGVEVLKLPHEPARKNPGRHKKQEERTHRALSDRSLAHTADPKQGVLTQTQDNPTRTRSEAQPEASPLQLRHKSRALLAVCGSGFPDFLEMKFAFARGGGVLSSYLLLLFVASCCCLRAVESSATMRFMEHLHHSAGASSSSSDGGEDEQPLFGERQSAQAPTKRSPICAAAEIPQ